MTNDNQDALRCADGVERMDTFTDYQRAELLKSAAHLRRLVAEIEAKDALLRQIALTAHCGGLASMSEAEALIAIRNLTRETFKGIGYLSESAIRQHLEGRA